MNNNEQVVQFNNGEYNDIYLKTDISPIKKYIDNVLGINCYLVPRILTKKMEILIDGVLIVIKCMKKHKTINNNMS